jgi:hypothetical protein
VDAASPTTWITTDPSGEGVAVRAVVFLLLIGVGIVLALAFRDAARGYRRGLGAAVRSAIGRPEPPAWARGEWACGACRSVNRRDARSCDTCRAPRAAVELAFAPPEAAPDILPEVIPAGAGSTVTLEHNAAAHSDGLSGHWRLRVNGVTVGSAATRDGALHLLRAVRDAEAVLFDPRGAGYAPYGLADLIRAFEGPRLPVSGPCPEAVTRRAEAAPPR